MGFHDYTGGASGATVGTTDFFALANTVACTGVDVTVQTLELHNGWLVVRLRTTSLVPAGPHAVGRASFAREFFTLADTRGFVLTGGIQWPPAAAVLVPAFEGLVDVAFNVQQSAFRPASVLRLRSRTVDATFTVNW